MQIRKAHENDDANTILELIYNTDEFIYPAFMKGNLGNYANLLLEDGMYNYNNIVLAIVDDEIAGIIVSFTNDTVVPKIDNQELQDYFEELVNSIDSQSEYINNVSVFKKFRGMGIATKLIAFVTENTTKSKVLLDCLVENTNALHLYEKLGFVITGIHPAFCLDKTKELKDARMEKVVA